MCRESTLFQSTLPARGATSSLIYTAVASLISIHAPRTGSDSPVTVLYSVSRYFNPRSPHGERRSRSWSVILVYSNFNPRSPHGERPQRLRLVILSIYFNPRSPHGERRAERRPVHDSQAISIHAPRTGSDYQLFQTPPMRRHISIHAPRTGSDTQQNYKIHLLESISIHAPRTGSDPVSSKNIAGKRIFQSTLPARGATPADLYKLTLSRISIHAPRTGSDFAGSVVTVVLAPFQSTLPARGAT